MQLIINEKNEIMGYARAGGLANSIKFSGDLPIDFETQFKPTFYLLKDNEIELNPNYVVPIPTVDGPSSTDKAIAQLTLQAAQQKVIQDKLNAQVLLEIAQLKGGNN